MQLMTIFAMLFAAGGVLFALQNHETVSVALFMWHFESSLAVVVLLTLALGGLVVALVSTPATLRRQWDLKRQLKRVGELELRCSTLERELADARRGTPRPDAAALYTEMPHLIAASPESGGSNNA